MEKQSLFFKKVSQYILAAYAAILVLLNIIRIFDNNFWSDEAYSIKLANLSIPQMLEETANDVHPPLHYLQLMFTGKILGQNGWVYHFSSIIPFLAVMVFTVIVIRKRFGTGTAFLFITFLGLSQNAVRFNVEVRMYSLAAAMVLFSFYGLLLTFEGRKQGYVLFVIASLGAAYSHYYALFSVAFFYLALLIQTITGKEKPRRLITVYALTILGYMPWLATMISTFESTAENFWMTGYSGLMSSVGYFYESDKRWYSYGMFAITVICLAVVAYRDTEGLLEVKQEDGKLAFCADRLKTMSDETVWSIWGIIAAVGTIFVGIMISVLIRPSFISRYLYPVVPVVWLVLCVNICKLKRWKIYTAVVLFVTLAVYIPLYWSVYTEEREMNDLCQKTQEQLAEYLSDDDVVLTNNINFSWTIFDYYFPSVKCKYTGSDYSKFKKKKKYWLAWGDPLTQEELRWLDNAGYKAEEKMDDGYLGDNGFCFYELFRE